MSNKPGKSFRPRRRPNQNYRPVKAKVSKRRPALGSGSQFLDLGDGTNLEDALGPLGAEFIEQMRRESELDYDQTEESLRMMDYLVAPEGSLEDRMGERRALDRDFGSDEERKEFMESLDEFIEEETLDELELDPKTVKKQYGYQPAQKVKYEYDSTFENELEPNLALHPNQLVHGDWSEMLVSVGRTVKLWRGGRLESYRAVVIGGNLNGCGGFGFGKSTDPMEAVNKASRATKRNIFFVDRYQNDGLTRDLVGKQNNCKVVLRTTDNGLRGNELCREILKRFGITNAVCKAYGRRSPYNMVLATFKALMTHESLEQIALKRGKRLMSLDRTRKMRIN